MKALFVFPAASGHLNPSLPLARGLGALGWSVEYLSTEQFKAAIEDTGAHFFDRDQVFKELGIHDVTALISGTFEEYGDPAAKQWALNFGSIAAERLLPAYKEWILSRQPQLIVYCPVLCQVAHFVAQQLQIPDISLLTVAGPGFLDAAMAAHPGFTAAGLISTIAGNEANQKAVEGIRKQLQMPQLSLNTTLNEPLIGDYYTAVNLVTTTEALADELNAADNEFYRLNNKKFIFTGPLLDQSFAKRASGLLMSQEQPQDQQLNSEHAAVMEAIRAAATAARDLVYVSMGTVITGDGEGHGWRSTDGTSITGKQLCQAVYQSIFDCFASPVGEGKLIVVSLGPQQDALEGLNVPGNAICAKSVPQVDLLREGRPVLFVTNGGQNSLMESMSVGTPVLVCPGFGDQLANAAKVQSQGWGLKVDRPKDTDKTCKLILDGYRAALTSAAQAVVQDKKFAAKASTIENSLQHVLGVDGAIQTMLAVAGKDAI